MKKLNRSVWLMVIALILVSCSTIAGNVDEPIEASGIVEVKEVRVAAEISGQVADVFVQEGAQVTAGDRLFELDAEGLELQLRQARATLRSTVAQEALARSNVTLANSTLEQAELGLAAARLQSQMQLATALEAGTIQINNSWRENQPADFELPGWYYSTADQIRAAEAELEAAQEAEREAEQSLADLIEELDLDELEQAEAELSLARAQLTAAELLNDRPVSGPEAADLRQVVRDWLADSRQELESAQLNYESLLTDEGSEQIMQARANLAAARGRRQAAQFGYFRLLSGENSLGVRLAQIQVEQAEAAIVQAETSLEQAEAQLASAGAAVEQAEAAVAASELQFSKRLVQAPLSGTVLSQSLDQGEVVQAGMTVLSIGDLSEIRITVYLPENRYGQISLGDKATVSVDSFEGEAFEAQVVRIADEAEYTPRNVQTQDERQSTVYAVELSVSDSDGRLKPGMPADVRFDS